MHNGHEEVVKLGKVILVHELDEPLLKDRNELVTITGLNHGNFDLFFELFERLVVSGFGLEEELENLFDLLRLELCVNGIEVLRFVLPETDLNQWVGVTLLEGLFWLEFQDVLNLFGPHDDAAFEDVGFVFLGDVVARSQFLRWSWQLGLTTDLSYGHKGLGQIIVKLLD